MALEKIGPYQFQGILGRGGMGSVYRGRHEETGELHAVKILAPTYADDPHFRGRFESEIKALLQLNHPNIVRLLSFGQEDGMLYFSMELVEGNSLFQMQRKGHRFDWRQSLSIAKDVAKGLRHAHDRGIIHRDLKPGNLLMTMDDDGKPSHVKITDFGIAKRFGSSQNTGTNVVGTMDFMSPEQAKGEPVTAKSDLYSLGSVLFTLMSGRPPFSANSVEESLRNLTRVPAPRISTVVPGVPRELDDLIKKLMAKRPENRIPTTQALIYRIDEVENTLRDYAEAQTAHVNPPKHIEDAEFNVSAPKTVANTRMRGEASTEASKKTNPMDIDATQASVDLEEPVTFAPATHVDYYNPVDDQVRKQLVKTEPDPEPTTGIIPLALALCAMIAVGGYLIYRTYLPPSAETLFVAIEENAENPNRALDEIELFLTHYPDDERAEKIAELKKIGDAVNLYRGLSNTLSVRNNLPGDDRLSPIEKQFLQIVELAQDQPVDADRQMRAFITVHESTEDLSEGDRKCIEAAKSYRVKLIYDAENRVRFNLRQIRSALNKASNTTDPEGAIPIYESILELYEKADWGEGEDAVAGQELVSKARNLLILMRDSKHKAELRAQREALQKEREKEEKEAAEKANNASPQDPQSTTDDSASGNIKDPGNSNDN